MAAFIAYGGSEFKWMHAEGGLRETWRGVANTVSRLAAQPQKPATAPLTDSQIVQALVDCGLNLAFRNYEQDIECARAIERTLREAA